MPLEKNKIVSELVDGPQVPGLAIMGTGNSGKQGNAISPGLRYLGFVIELTVGLHYALNMSLAIPIGTMTTTTTTIATTTTTTTTTTNDDDDDDDDDDDGSVDRSVDGSVDGSVDRSVDRSVKRSVGGSVDGSVDRPFDLPHSPS